MAWATKYQFKFNSSHGVEHRILIQKDGYSGGIIKRSLGRGPVLKKQKNGPICGTSLEIYAECTIDGEFAQDFFTSNPKDLRVRLYRGNNLIWTGFVSAETYSEPNIAPPYDVQIVATDGLGELKLVTFVPAGAVTLSEHFRTALSYAGEGHTIYVASALIMTGQATTATFGMSINLDYLADKSYYDVLTALLDSLHATITMYNGNWLIARETDLSSLLSGSGLSVVQIAANGTVSTTTLAGVAKTVGSLADNTKDTWPVGYLSTAIEPARREVTVEAPWHTVSGPADPSMEATTGSPWTTEGQVTHNTTDDCYYELGLNQSDPTDRTWGTIKQEIPINKLDCGFELKLRVSPRVYKLRQGDTQWYARGLIKVHLEYDLTVTQTTPHTTTYIGTEEGWSGAPRAESDPSVDIPVTELDSIGERWLSVDIPAIATPDSSSRYLVSDTAVVRIVIEGYWVDVYECIITPTLDLPGYQDVITINNGARGAENAVEITGGRVRSDNLVNNMFYGGIWLYGGVPVTSFADSQNQGGDFLAIAALSYASSVANARLRTEGSINVPADFANLPLFLTVEDVPAWLETWDWDLLGDEVQLSLLSLPANQITVESETVTGLPEGYSGGSSRGSGSGSSAASSYSYKSGGSNYFEEDGEGGIRLKDEYNGLTIPGFIKSKGDQIVIDGDPGGGGGGGVLYLNELLDVTITLPANGQTLFYQDGEWVNGNIDFSNYYTKAQVDDIIGTIQQFHYEVYASLEDVIDPQNNVLYLIGPTGSGEDKYEEYVYSGGWVKIGDTSIDLSGYVQTTRLDADEAIIAEAIQSLQSQIDAVSARDNYDELTASSLYADMLSATYAYAERYYLTDGVFFYIEIVNGIPCVKLNAPFITEGDQVIISGTPGGGGGGGITLYDYDQVKAMTADVALTAPSAWAMHQMWAEIFGGASSVLTSDNYTNYVNTTNFPGLDKVGTVTSVATGTGLTGGPITASGTISIDPTYLGYISHGETAYGWGDILTQAIQSLQFQIDSVSARNNYDELTASAFFGDMVSASALYAGSIELAGEDLGTAVTGIRTRISSVENKFDADGSALSAVRLKNTRTLWGQNFDGTANVVGNMTSVGSIDASGLIKTTNYAQAQRFYLTDSIYFYTETIDGVACVMLNAPFVTSGDQIIISGTPGGGGQGVGYLYELEDVSDALASPTNGMVLFYNGTEWVGVAASSIGGVTSVVGQTGAVTTEQVASALTAAGYKLTDTITTSLAWSAITNKPTTLAGYGITDAASASALAALATRVGTIESDEAIVSAAIQSLQSQIDSVSARDAFDELTATSFFADTLSASDAYIDNITGSLSGNAATASRLVGASYNVGNVNKPVYFSGGLPVETTYAIYASLFNGTAGRLAYYNTANLVSDYTGNVGSATQPMHLVAGVPTACTYTLGAALLAATTAGKLAYYSGTNSVSSYTSTIGSGVIPMYLNAGVPTASTSTVGSAALPVYLNGGTITACSGASIFSYIGSNTVNNLELTIAGQLRTATLYATYDSAGENISDKLGIVGQAIQSLQSQVDSVSARNSFDELDATVGFIDTLSVGDAVYSAKGCIAQYLTVGQTSIAATYPLYVVGVIASTGDQVVTSDATKKTNLKDIALSVGQIASAPAVTFDWKTGGHSFGSIAQYWRDVLPESVLGDEGDYSLAYAQLALVSAINLAKHETEQDREIRELKEKVARLENEVERLRN